MFSERSFVARSFALPKNHLKIHLFRREMFLPKSNLPLHCGFCKVDDYCTGRVMMGGGNTAKIILPQK